MGDEDEIRHIRGEILGSVIFVVLVFDACRFELSAVHSSASVSLVLSITTADDTIASLTRILLYLH